MNFPVPWRCLLPREAVDWVTYDGSAILRELSERTGAGIDVSGDHDTPRRLSDRIVTLSGQLPQKEGACRGLVDRLRTLRELWNPQDSGSLVIMIPAAAVPVVVGAKGGNIQEVLQEAAGVELSIGKENIMGTADTPIGLEGTAEQVVAACVGIHRAIQDMADRGRLMPSDFKYRPDKAAAALAAGAGQGMQQVGLPPAEHDALGGLDPTQNFRTKAKLVVDRSTAGWLIGKGGRTVREMQANSGAFLHIIQEGEGFPVGLRPGDCVVEICGRYERKLEGLQVVLRTADSMPAGQAPRESRVLVPHAVATPQALEEVSTAFGCVVEVEAASCLDETLVQISGTISSRVQAAQSLLARTDRAHMDGTAVARSVDGEVVGRDGRPREETRERLRESGLWPPPAPEPAEDARPRAPLPLLPRLVSERQVPAEWVHRQAVGPVGAGEDAGVGGAAAAQPEGPSGAEAALQAPVVRGPAPLPAAAPAAHVAMAATTPASAAAAAAAPAARLAMAAPAAVPAAAAHVPLASPALAPQAPASAAAPAAVLAAAAHVPLASPAPAPQAPASASAPAAVPAAAAHVPLVSPALAPQAPASAAAPAAVLAAAAHVPLASPAPAPQAPASASAPAAAAVPVAHAPLAAPEPALQSPAAMSAPAAHAPAAQAPPAPPERARGPARAWAEVGGAAALLQASSRLAQAQGQLQLLVPDPLLQHVLIPGGHLSDLARRFQVHIDLCGEVLPPGRRVVLTGAIAANAAAAVWLQAVAAGS